MKTTIHTERLDLIPSVEPCDLNNYISDLRSTDDFFFQYGEPYSDELLEAIDFHSTNVAYYSIFLKNTQTMVGYIGIHPYEDEPAYGEIEFYIFHNYRGQGFCKEAIAAYADSFFSGSLTGVKGRRILAETLTENEVVIKLLESMKFERESIGMRLPFTEDGGIDHDKTIIGTRRYKLSAGTRLGE